MSDIISESNQMNDEEKQYGLMKTMTSVLTFQILPFNYIEIGFLKIILYYCSLLVAILAFNAPIIFLYHGTERFGRVPHLVFVLVGMFMATLFWGSFISGETEEGIRRPTYAQIVYLLILSFVYWPVYTLIFYFLPVSLSVQLGYKLICSILSFVFCIRNLLAIWKFSKSKFFFIVFSIVWIFINVNCLSLFVIYLHGTDDDVQRVIKIKMG